MEFDSFTFVILMRPADAPDLDEVQARAVQDAHLAFISNLQERGLLVAAGPVVGATDPAIRGFGIFPGSPDEVRELMKDDPGTQANVFDPQVMTWMVPKGAVHFEPTRFPASVAEVLG